MDPTKFVIWKKKILQILRSYELQDFVLSGYPYLLRSDAKGKVNTKYRYWMSDGFMADNMYENWIDKGSSDYETSEEL